MNFDNCPTCGKSLKGLFSKHVLISQTKIDFINKYSDKKSEHYCTSCSAPILKELGSKFRKQYDDIQKRLKEIIMYIPILTCSAPPTWQYEVVGIQSAQTTSGTGFVTELSRSFNDFFGTSSNTSSQKISGALTRCKSEIRIKCIKAGGNAIVGTNISYNEIGTGNTNMLMLAINGTVIKVTDLQNFNSKSREYLAEILDLTEQLDAIAEFPS